MSEDQLAAEIAVLEGEVAAARNEFYLLHTSYAAQHFKLQSAMRSAELERLSGSAVSAAAALLRTKCEEFEQQIATLRAALRDAGIDPDAR
jgi:hypothetical protein